MSSFSKENAAVNAIAKKTSGRLGMKMEFLFIIIPSREKNGAGSTIRSMFRRALARPMF
jgi:hypothetical protein